MLSVDEIRIALQDRRLLVVANATGLHYNTLRLIRDGKATDPKNSTVKALSDYLQGVTA